MREARLGPKAVDDCQPFFGAGVAVVVLVKLHPVLLRFFRPPRRHHVQRQSPAADVIYVCRLFRQQRRSMIRGPDCDHQLQALRHRRQRRRRRPGIEARRVHALDVVEVQLGDERQVKPDLLRAHRQLLRIVPRSVHVLIVHIPQPAAKHRQPVSIAHLIILLNSLFKQSVRRF